MKNKKQTKRDIILIISLLIIVSTIFVLFNLRIKNQEVSEAHIYYGNNTDPIVTIDFSYNNGEGRVIKNLEQIVPEEYGKFPIINLEEQTVTLLGDYVLNGKRQIVVIKYDFKEKSVQIIKEQSPNNICSREGKSTGKPLICLPNRIRVEFKTSDEDFII
jgi:hypothetical protein